MLFYGDLTQKEFSIRSEDSKDESFKEFSASFTRMTVNWTRERDRGYVFCQEISYFVFDREILRGKH